jgi:hypothetical protein
MKGYIPVEIPTKLYIKGFILNKLGPKPLMTRDNFIGTKLCDLMEHRTNERMLRFSKKRYNTTMRIYISMYLFRQRGCNLNENNLKNFNRFLEAFIKERFYFIMDFYIDVFPSFEANLPGVRKYLGISDEFWDDDSMRKNYYRYRIIAGKPLLYKKNLTATVPSGSLANNAF